MAQYCCQNHQTKFVRSQGEGAWCPGCIADEITRIQGATSALNSVRDIIDDTAGNIYRLRAQGKRYLATQLDEEE